ncbi:MAG TPA: radical SAM protein [Malonomonas sp.]
MTDTLLIQPPALKASEPPLALAILRASLQQQGCRAEVLDANLGAYLYLLDGERLAQLAGAQPATFVKRALRHREDSLRQLRSLSIGKSFARYSTAIGYLNQLLALWCPDGGGERLTLGDYQHNAYSMFNPADLELFASGQSRTLFHDYFVTELLPQVARLAPASVAISINYLHQVFPAFELAGLLKVRFPQLPIIAGGGLITSWQEPLRSTQLRFSVFDHVVFGPGEAPIAAVIKGQAGGNYFLNDAAQLSFGPDFAFAELSAYLSPEPVLPVSSSRGCYWQNCLFCPEATAPVHPFATTAVKGFPALLRQLQRQYGVRTFHLTDNAIPVNILNILAGQAAVMGGLNWFGFVRFEAALEDAAFARQLAVSGCRMLQLGLESGSQQVLDRLEKGVQLASAEKILQNLAAAGIASYVYIMLGTPGETQQDAELTRDFLLKHADNIGFLNLSIMNLPRSSGLLDDPQHYGITAAKLRDADGPLGLYQEFQTSGDWDRGAARRFLDKRLLGSPIIRAIVNRTPPMFTSNHAVFFTSTIT